MLKRMVSQLGYKLVISQESPEVNGCSDYIGCIFYPRDVRSCKYQYTEPTILVNSSLTDNIDEVIIHELGHAICDKLLGEEYHKMSVGTRETLADNAQDLIKSLQ